RSPRQSLPPDQGAGRLDRVAASVSPIDLPYRWLRACPKDTIAMAVLGGQGSPRRAALLDVFRRGRITSAAGRSRPARQAGPLAPGPRPRAAGAGERPRGRCGIPGGRPPAARARRTCARIGPTRGARRAPRRAAAPPPWRGGGARPRCRGRPRTLASELVAKLIVSPSDARLPAGPAVTERSGTASDCKPREGLSHR